MPRFLTNIPSILRLSLLFFLPHLTSRAEAAPLVASEAILVPATQGKFDYLKVVDQIAFDPGNKRIYCASGRAGLSVVEETTDGLRFVATIPTPSGAHTIAVDPATHAVWIAYAKENESFVCKLSVPQ